MWCLWIFPQIRFLAYISRVKLLLVPELWFFFLSSVHFTFCLYLIPTYQYDASSNSKVIRNIGWKKWTGVLNVVGMRCCLLSIFLFACIVVWIYRSCPGVVIPIYYFTSSYFCTLFSYNYIFQMINWHDKFLQMFS